MLNLHTLDYADVRHVPKGTAFTAVARDGSVQTGVAPPIVGLLLSLTSFAEITPRNAFRINLLRASHRPVVDPYTQNPCQAAFPRNFLGAHRQPGARTYKTPLLARVVQLLIFLFPANLCALLTIVIAPKVLPVSGKMPDL